APVLVRFIAQIASRFGVVVTQKLAAQAVPVIGALGGAAVNYAFIDHFQEVARAHFVVRRLERRYGKDAVRAVYERVCGETKAAPREPTSTASLGGHPATKSGGQEVESFRARQYLALIWRP